MPVPQELDAELNRLAATPVLLIACDYDGTLAPIVSDPREAHPKRESVVALRNLAGMSQTPVAVISGRALRDLASLIGAPEDIHLVGSHGSEFDLDFATHLPDEARQLRERLREELVELSGTGNGFAIEEKPASIAFHYRNAADDEADRALSRILEGPACYEGVVTRHGKKVIELGVVTTHKGAALDMLRHRVGATAAIFIGDDLTDEDAFATLRGPDIGIKVGDGETAASFRVKDSDEVAQLLARLCEARSAWLSGATAVPIAHHALLSDQRTMALVTPAARIVWFCFPRIDSPAIFAEILGGPTAGYFSISDATGISPTGQRYEQDSMVLQTAWPTFTVTDFLDCSYNRSTQRPGRTDLVRVIEGRGRVRIEFAPRPNFGRIPTRMQQRDGGMIVEDTLEPIALHAPGITWAMTEEGSHQTAVAEVDLDDQPLILELRCGTARLKPAQLTEPERRRQTTHHWADWAGGLAQVPIHGDLVRRSALTLKALCYGPTGAILAAPTTSLPEHIGGVRNWDYRASWLRDGAMSAAALVRLGSLTEAMQFLDWVFGVLDDCPGPEQLHPVYTVTGEQLGPEAEIGELSGYRGSRPVRVSNAASHQVQLDVFGPIVELISLLAERGAPLSSQHWKLIRAMVKAVSERWQEADHGIWEVRLARRHHVHSKIMCWLAVDRAIAVANHTLDQEPDGWPALRDAIAADVLERGWSEPVQAFTTAYGEVDLDAAALFVGLTGLLPPDDPRVEKTIDAVDQHLREGPVVYRYRGDDGLPGIEGGFHICTGWLIESLLLIGRTEQARQLFDEMCELAGPTMLLSEQYEPTTGESLGNHPQAFSHLAIINGALRLAEAGAHTG